MTTQLSIRPYAPDDTERLLAIWHAASLVGHPFFTPEQIDEHKARVRDIYLPKAETYVATRAGHAIGFIGLLDCFVGGLFVDPEHHRAGAGRHLVAYALAIKEHLTLEVYALNRGAVAFYHGLGFVEVSRRPTDDDGLPFELIEMRR